jgi:uncharacterized protein (TIGR02246 family)
MSSAHSSVDSSLAADEAAIRRLAALYARAVDRNEPDTLRGLFTADAVLEGPGFTMRGHAELAAIPGMLHGMYHRTLHQVHQQTVQVDGDHAWAETYCTANHLSDRGGGVGENLSWAMRYHDEFIRHDGRWLFSRRQVLIDWTETHPAQLPPAPVTG